LSTAHMNARHLLMSVQKAFIGAAVGLANLAILLSVWHWWLRRTALTNSSVDSTKFTSHGEAAEQAAFMGDAAYSYGEFAGGSDSRHIVDTPTRSEVV
jgi:hypothetical protein